MKSSRDIRWISVRLVLVDLIDELEGVDALSPEGGGVRLFFAGGAACLSFFFDADELTAGDDFSVDFLVFIACK